MNLDIVALLSSSGVGAVIASLVNYIVSRRKIDVDQIRVTQEGEVVSFETIMKAQFQLYTDLKAEFDSYKESGKKEIAELESEIETLKEENRSLRDEIQKLRAGSHAGK